VVGAAGVLGSLISGGHGMGQKTQRTAVAPSSAAAWQQDVDQLIAQATAAFTQALTAAR
jgi:hypothetical protein